MSYRATNLPLEKHIFLGRKGGVSEGKYASLNIRDRSSDDPQAVAENRRIAVEQLGMNIRRLVMLRQMSATNVVLVEQASQGIVEADGMVCKVPGLVLGIGTADCLPVLLADYEHGVIGAAHAGWRGAVRGVVENTLKLMLAQGAVLEEISAALGPCIQQSSFEVGADVRDECTAVSPVYAAFFAPGKDAGHFQFDLEGLVCRRLEQFGVRNITASGIDTYADEENYFSFRRDTHRGLTGSGSDFGGHVSLITL